jgi:hypothetical protein
MVSKKLAAGVGNMPHRLRSAFLQRLPHEQHALQQG